MTTLQPSLVGKPRISSIDMMRGIVMVIMALDHTRDFYHINANVFDPTDLSRTSPLLFLTRWITHFCAPTFVFLSGIAIRLNREKKPARELSRFLLTRGLWLILLEVTVVRFGITFNLYYDFNIFQVIWVIGASMVVLSALVYLSDRAILIVGLVLLFSHNVFDFFPLKPDDAGYILWVFVRQTGVIPLNDTSFLLVVYPLIPWLAIMLMGYGMGMLYTGAVAAATRQRMMMRIGVGAFILFIALRFSNLYGDPAPWSVQKSPVFTVLSFINCTKYPVSLCFTLMILSITTLALVVLERVNLDNIRPIQVYGRVPMFYYILHFYLIHFTALLVRMALYGYRWTDFDFHFSKTFGGVKPGEGVSLFWTYVAWVLIVAALYPLCVWYNRYKSANRQWWLSYV